MLTLTLVIHYLVELVRGALPGRPPAVCKESSLKLDPQIKSLSASDEKEEEIQELNRTDTNHSIQKHSEVKEPPPLEEPTQSAGSDDTVHTNTAHTNTAHTDTVHTDTVSSAETMATHTDLNQLFSRLGIQQDERATTSDGRVSREGQRQGQDPSITREMRRNNKFAFLVHPPTVDYVRRSRAMFVMRGLPGSGKSTVVRLLMETYPESVACSADDHFLQRDGSYRFRQDKLSEAHEECQRKAWEACERGSPVVIIDNTNVRMWEMKHYTSMAARHGYAVITVEPRTPWRFDARELARRNKHGVGEDIIRKKLQSYEDGIPLYYGWFLNRAYSGRIMEMAEKYFSLLKKACPSYQMMINDITGVGQRTTLASIYGREGSSSDNLHCTAFFSNRGRTPTSGEYRLQPHVVEALGRTFTIHVVGLMFTRQTVGARVRLEPKLMPLWGKDDSEGMAAAAAGRGPVSGRRRPGRGRLTDNPSSSHYDRTSSSGGGRDVFEEEPVLSQFRPVVGDGSRAHLTIGYTRACTAVQTGFDLMEVVRHEHLLKDERQPKGIVTVDGAAVRCYDGTHWVVYLDEPVALETLFSGRYC